MVDMSMTSNRHEFESKPGDVRGQGTKAAVCGLKELTQFMD